MIKQSQIGPFHRVERNQRCGGTEYLLHELGLISLHEPALYFVVSLIPKICCIHHSEGWKTKNIWNLNRTCVFLTVWHQKFGSGEVWPQSEIRRQSLPSNISFCYILLMTFYYLNTLPNLTGFFKNMSSLIKIT